LRGGRPTETPACHFYFSASFSLRSRFTAGARRESDFLHGQVENLPHGLLMRNKDGHPAHIMRKKSTLLAHARRKGYALVCQKGPFAHIAIATVFQTQIAGAT
jgi:hypothetical protein